MPFFPSTPAIPPTIPSEVDGLFFSDTVTCINRNSQPPESVECGLHAWLQGWLLCSGTNYQSAGGIILPFPFRLKINIVTRMDALLGTENSQMLSHTWWFDAQVQEGQVIHMVTEGGQFKDAPRFWLMFLLVDRTAPTLSQHSSSNGAHGRHEEKLLHGAYRKKFHPSISKLCLWQISVFM